MKYNQWFGLTERTQIRSDHHCDRHSLFRLDFTVGACMLIRVRDAGVFADIGIEIASARSVTS